MPILLTNCLDINQVWKSLTHFGISSFSWSVSDKKAYEWLGMIQIWFFNWSAGRGESKFEAGIFRRVFNRGGKTVMHCTDYRLSRKLSENKCSILIWLVLTRKVASICQIWKVTAMRSGIAFNPKLASLWLIQWQIRQIKGFYLNTEIPPKGSHQFWRKKRFFCEIIS